MSKEPGPREKALREQREAKFAAEQARQKDARNTAAVITRLRGDVAEAAKKTGKSRKKGKRK